MRKRGKAQPGASHGVRKTKANIVREASILRDRASASQGFAFFAGSTIADGGRSIIFRYPSGIGYKVPLEYLLLWLLTPREAPATLRIVRARILKDPHVIRVYLSDGSRYNFVWDCVLMACEPRYEHFGGFTPHFKDLVAGWFKEHGPIRIPDERGLASRARSSAIIRDRTLGRQGFSQFTRSAVGTEGQSLYFEYPSGARYRVPLAYLLTWFEEPHEPRKKENSADLRVATTRRFSDSQFVLVRLTDGRGYYVAADTVLMACEPRYEHFGGLTPMAQQATKEAWLKLGPFRVHYSLPKSSSRVRCA